MRPSAPLSRTSAPPTSCPPAVHCSAPARPAAVRSPAPSPRASASHGERGSATAETAVLLPVLLAVLAAALFVLSCVAAQLACVDAARAAARAAARGDAPAVVQEAGQRVAPEGARITLVVGDDQVEVRVSAAVRPFGRVLRLPAVPVAARAVAAAEPGAYA